MTLEQLKNAHDAKPFRPFTIHVVDGTLLEVPHPELLWRTPSGQTIFVSKGGEDVSIVDRSLVTQMTMDNGSAGGRRKK